MELQGGGYAVCPRADCAHIRLIEGALPVTGECILPPALDRQPPCEECGDTSENWVCLQCNEVLCSRYVNGDMARHAETLHTHDNPCVALSFSDLSFWCFACDDYITADWLEAWLRDACEASTAHHEAVAAGAAAAESSSSAQELRSESPESFAGEPLTLADLVQGMKEGRARNIIVVTGAGLSTSAGIPDFRSENGLYATLGKYGVDPTQLDHPTQVFELEYFRENPEPFWAVTKELFYQAAESKPHPTPGHAFLRLLQDKGYLRRVYTQNIDGLEFAAGLSPAVVVQAHGGNQTATCITAGCKTSFDVDRLEREVRDGKIPTCDNCGGLVKNDVILFGEALPARVFQCLISDRDALRGETPEEEDKRPDLVMVIGTSLQVAPISLIPSIFRELPRVLINREVVGDFDPDVDCLLLGDIDAQVQRLAELCGWEGELEAVLSSLRQG